MIILIFQSLTDTMRSQHQWQHCYLWFGFMARVRKAGRLEDGWCHKVISSTLHRRCVSDCVSTPRPFGTLSRCQGDSGGSQVHCIHIHAVYSISGALYLPSCCLERLMHIELMFMTHLTRLHAFCTFLDVFDSYSHHREHFRHILDILRWPRRLVFPLDIRYDAVRN
jgi:hypothetical protein